MPEPRLDTVCDALAAQKRRDVCRYVAATDRDVVTLDDLAGYVESEVRDSGSPSGTTDSGRETRTRLHHVELPKLADAGVIEYEPGRRVVTEGPALPIAADLVRNLEGVVDRRGRS